MIFFRKNKIFNFFKDKLKVSFGGLKLAFHEELALRLEMMVLIFIVPLAFYFGNSKLEIILLIFSWWLVIIVELINTALENIIDRISLEKHLLSKKVKDISSAAVFMSIMQSVLIWFFILVK